jgi:hypothetical protein
MRSLVILCVSIFLNFDTIAAVGDCERALQVLKKNWPKYSAIDAPSTSVGIEVEGAIPGFKSRRDVARSIQGILDRILQYRQDASVDESITSEQGKWGRDYHVRYWLNRRLMVIKVVEDPSIPKDKGLAVEIVSPVIREPEELKVFLDVLSSLKHELKMTPIPDYAGVHVHVGLPDFRLSEVAVLLAIFTLVEPRLLNVVPIQSQRQRFTKPVEHIYADLHPEHRQDLRHIKSLIFSQDSRDRWRTLNILSLAEHGTVEFRYLNSTLSLPLILYTVDFCTKLVRAARMKNEHLFQYLTTTEPDQIRVNGVASILGMDMANRQDEIQELNALDIGRPIASHIGIRLAQLDAENSELKEQLRQTEAILKQQKSARDRLVLNSLNVAVIVTGTAVVFWIIFH